MICSSWPVPSVATQNACVSPRVNSAEPCARGRMPTSAMIGRTVRVSRPSIRMPVSRMALRTMSASRSWNTDLRLLGVQPVGRQRLHHLRAHRIDLVVPRALVRLAIGLGQSRAGQRIDAGLQRLLLGRRLGQRPRLLGRVLGQLDDRLDHRLEALDGRR